MLWMDFKEFTKFETSSLMTVGSNFKMLTLITKMKNETLVWNTSLFIDSLHFMSSQLLCWQYNLFLQSFHNDVGI